MTFSEEIEISIDAIMHTFKTIVLRGDQAPHMHAVAMRMLLEHLVQEVIEECSSES